MSKDAAAVVVEENTSPTENDVPAEEPSVPVIEPVKQAAKTAAEPKPAAVLKAEPAASVDGGALFGQKCASCHGVQGEKAALGKSQVIAGWNAAKVKDALKGYQDGTYGKEMKALMLGQVKGLNDAQIDAVAKHISEL
jgi:cytochrome c553